MKSKMLPGIAFNTRVAIYAIFLSSFLCTETWGNNKPAPSGLPRVNSPFSNEAPFQFTADPH
jgi:hypothetical protein